MVAINEILSPECTGEECGGDNDICTDSRVHHRNAENRAPVNRNRRSAPILGRWLTRDPIGYRGGINLYGYVNSSPVGNVDGTGSSKDTYKPDKSGKHGGPHVDRYNPRGHNVGRYKPGGTPIPHGGKCPPPIPNSDRERFDKAAGDLAKGAVVVGTGSVAAEVAYEIAEALLLTLAF